MEGETEMLSKTIALSIKGYEVKLSSPIKLFYGDAIHLKFVVSEYGLNPNTNVREPYSVMPLNAYMIIEQPNDETSDKIESVDIIDNEITFHIDARYTSSIGIGRMQLIFTDANCCKITVPYFNYEVAENIYGDKPLVFSDTLLTDYDNRVLGLSENEVITAGLTLDSNAIKLKLIKDLQTKGLLDGSELMVIQDGNSTKHTTFNTIYNYIIETFKDRIQLKIDSVIGTSADELLKLQTDVINELVAVEYLKREYENLKREYETKLTDVTNDLVAVEYLKREYEAKLNELELLKQKYEEIINGGNQ